MSLHTMTTSKEEVESEVIVSNKKGFCGKTKRLFFASFRKKAQFIFRRVIHVVH